MRAGWVFVIWLGACLAGFSEMLRYEATPGTVGLVRSSIPFRTRTETPNQPLLMMFAHPLCACTTASLNELARILTHGGQPLAIEVVVLSDPRLDPSTSPFGIESRAAALPGVTVRRDPLGRLAASFGIETSGHVLLYDADGNLRFSGGITALRGHEGDNPGKSRLLDALAGLTSRAAPPSLLTAPVFGCPLHDMVPPQSLETMRWRPQS